MRTKKYYGVSNYAIGFITTMVAALYLVIDSFIIGKNKFFLLLNGGLGKEADLFFSCWTWLGDGIVWIPVTILFFLYRKNKFPLLIAAIIISTLLTQLTKNYIFPAQLRPTAAITDGSSIHVVPGVELHTAYSFPSGHTATAFTIYLLACLLINKKWVLAVGFICALLVGYSRVYLAQHFPLDVGGGMMAALLTMLLSMQIQKRWEDTKVAS